MVDALLKSSTVGMGLYCPAIWRLKMKRKLMLTLLCSGGAMMAHAGHGDVENVMRAKQNIREAVYMAREAIDRRGDYGRGRGSHGGRGNGERIFVAVGYKLRIAQSDIMAISRSREQQAANNALNVAQEKIADYRLDVYDKLDLLEDCAKVALENLDDILDQNDGRGGRLGNLETSIRFMQNSVRLAQQGYFFEAEDSLLAAKAIIRRYPREQSLDAAMNAINVSLQKVSDPRLDRYERLRFLQDCAQQFERFVEQSQALRRESHGGGGHRPTPPTRPQPPSRPVPPRGGLSCADYSKSGFLVRGGDTKSVVKTCSNNDSGRIFVRNVSLSMNTKYLRCNERIINGGKSVEISCRNTTRGNTKSLDRITLQCCNR